MANKEIFNSQHSAPISNNDPFVNESFRLSNRLARGLWQFVWGLLFRPSPRILHGWRATLLRIFGAQIGPHVHVYSNVRIWAPWNLIIEGYVGVGEGAILYNMASISLGHHCVVSQGAHLCAGTHDIHSPNFQLQTEPIALAPFTWVCAEAFVGPGVCIAEGCVLGARAVVMKPISIPWSVWAGNPVRQLGMRKPALAEWLNSKSSKSQRWSTGAP